MRGLLLGILLAVLLWIIIIWGGINLWEFFSER